MISPIRLQRFSQFLLKENIPNLFSSLRLLVNLHSHYPSTLIWFYPFKLSTPPYSTSRIPHNQNPENAAVEWNLTIKHASATNPVKALSLFQEMLGSTNESTTLSVDPFIYASLIKACNKTQACLEAKKDLNSGRMMHALAKSFGIECDISVGTALINMYAKCSKLGCARKLFDDLPKQNIESWNAMMHAYVENGLAVEAIKLFDQIKCRNLEPDESKDLLRENTCLGNALIDMYAKCGSMKQAGEVFDCMGKKDVISWTSLISGYAINGEGVKSLDTFEHMCAQKIAPNFVTFIGVLSACDHGGLLHVGRKLYDIMQDAYGIEPQIQHYGSMISMLSRAGRIDEARKFIGEIVLEPNPLVWRMLINACCVHGNINLGLNLLGSLTKTNTSNDSGDRVISSNIFAAAGRWDDVISQRNLMVKQGSLKVAGKSSLSCLTE
ncbi:pentatricopeptide repeat-containing protein-like [Dorcoceras hygrometricum]|nr:pentatricopeptide repeat-containing protein-like [Dorcoceras hygrometricum]